MTDAWTGSAGTDGPHDCSQVLYRLHEYLDGEIGPIDARHIAQHLAECGPCLQQHDIDRAVKALIKRSCACEEAPVQLRATIMQRITTIRVDYRES